MLNWNEIRDRIFQAYNSPKQIVLAEMLGVDRATISKWMTENEKDRRNPTMEILEKIVKDKGVTWDWLLTGKSRDDKAESPQSETSGEGAILPHLSRMAVELMNILNDFHLRTLEGVVTAEQFESILLAATGGMLEAARECGVEPKKAIG